MRNINSVITITLSGFGLFSFSNFSFSATIRVTTPNKRLFNSFDSNSCFCKLYVVL